MMSIKNCLLGAVTSLVIAFSASAFAHFDTNDAVGDYASGIYMGIAGGYGHSNWGDTEDHLMQLGYTVADVDSGAFGLKGFLGYDFNEHFGVEMGYLHVFDNMNYKIAINAVCHNEIHARDAGLIRKRPRFLRNLEFWLK